MKKDRTVLYGALVLIGVYVFIQYKKNKNSEEETSSFSGDRKRAKIGICSPPKIYCAKKRRCTLPAFCKGYDETPY